MATPTVRIQTFPNNEVRCVFYYARDKSDKGTPVHPPSSESLLDITSKLETPPPGRQEYLDEIRPEDSPKVGFGRPGEGNGFSTNGRRRLMRAGAVLDSLTETPDQVLFCTGTLPGSTYESKLAIAAWSGWVVHAVKAWMAKRVPSKHDMYVWEFQKRGALHLHYAILVKDESTRKRIISEWKSQWERIIDGISRRSGVDCWRKNSDYTHAIDKSVLQADCQECTKSIARYLSKYVSKSQKQYLENHWAKCKPSRFWGISRPLCALLTEQTQTETIRLANRREFEAGYEDCLSVVQSYALVEHHYEVPKIWARVIVGYTNPGERTWLLRKLMTSISLKGSTFAMCQSERDKLCLQISQSLQDSKMLRSFVLEWSTHFSMHKDITMGLSTSESPASKDSLILSYRFYIGHAIMNRPFVPEPLRQLHRRLTEYCTVHLGSLCTPIAHPQEKEPIVESNTNDGTVQLTLGP
jgi:hypothetical protein